ncbi:hypothetical protein L2E82_47518 [Cichorium intybus]|uniref:Uncharacterized protein n=1 Tax=Cichorium intybus TaxID=13427 RepID=A0ACB8YV03_CICIN|nr:hypothetical protein L2E82_47518 [Cichorium intybus]
METGDGGGWHKTQKMVAIVILSLLAFLRQDTISQVLPWLDLDFNLPFSDKRILQQLGVGIQVAIEPINLGAYVRDESMELLVLVDRAIGGVSLVDGQIQLMLHRRLLYDDKKGLGEVLNDTVCVLNDCKGLMIQGKYYIRIDPIGNGTNWRSTYGQEVYSPLLLAFLEQDGNDWKKNNVSSFSMIDASYSLSNNTAIITLQELQSGKVLLRLAHLHELSFFQVGVGPAATWLDPSLDLQVYLISAWIDLWIIGIRSQPKDECSDEAIAAYIEAFGQSLKELSLNHVDKVAVQLKKTCNQSSSHRCIQTKSFTTSMQKSECAD